MMGSETISRPVSLSSLPRRQVNITFAGVLLAMFLSSLDQTIVGTAMPRIISDLGGFSHYTWVTSAYIITSAVIIPITGKLTDMYGRKVFYISGLVIFTLASLLCGLSTTITQIIVFRGLQGIGAGIMMANAFTVIGDLFPPAERGKYQGYISAVFGISSIIGPTLGGYLTDTLSWNWVFYVNIPLGILIILLFIKYFPNLRPDNLKHHIDYAGLVTLILTVVPTMMALSWAGVEYPWDSPIIIGTFVFSAGMLGLFIVIEKHAREPIIPLSLFSYNIVTISLIVVFLTGIGMFGTLIFVPLYFQGVIGTTATSSGTFLIPMMLGMIVGSFISGQMLSRAGGHYRIQGSIGIGIMGAGIALLSRMTPETSNTIAVMNIVITGFGLGIILPLYTIAVQNAVPYRFLGVASSATAFFRSIGGSVGLAILGSVMNNKFAAEFIGRLPAQIKAVVPVDNLTSLAQNPQALVSPEAQAQLQNFMSQFGAQGTAFYEQILQVLRGALSLALGQVFFIGFIILVIAFVVNFFIHEIPLRKQY